MTTKDFTYFRAIIEEQIPFHRLLGVKVRFLGEGVCTLYVPFREELVGDSMRSTLHGGVLSTLIVTCGGFAVWSMCNFNDKISTIDMRVDYLRPAFDSDLVAESRVRFVGNRVGNAHTVVYPDGAPDNILAEGRSVYNIKRESPR